MKAATREKLSWLVFESVLIVLSILLAFSVDAWWDAQQERNEEKRIIQSILAEFQALDSYLQNSRPFLTAMRDASDTLVHASLEGGTKLTGARIDELLADLLWRVDGALYGVPILKAMIGSGELGVVSNPELRRDLVVWSVRMDRISAVGDECRDFQSNHLEPFMRANASLPQIRNAVEHVPGSPNSIEGIGELIPYNVRNVVDHSYLLKDQEFQGLMFSHVGVIGDLLFLTRDDMKAALGDLIIRLEKELGELD